MDIRLSNDLVWRYITGKVSETERIEVETAVSHNAICRMQLRAAKHLHDNFDSIWDTMTAEKIGKTWLKARSKVAVAPLPTTGISALLMRLRLSFNDQGHVVAQGGEKWRVALPTENAPQIAKAAGNIVPEDQIGNVSELSEKQRSAKWSVALGVIQGRLEITAESIGSGLWAVSCFLTGCEDAAFRQKARVHVLTDKGEEMVQLPLQNTVAIRLKPGLWKIKICQADKTYCIEIELDSPAVGS